MKKVRTLITFILAFLPLGTFVESVHAQAAASPSVLQINISSSALPGVNPTQSLGQLLTSILTIIFIAAALAVLFFLVIGAFRWITSGGEKEKVKEARDTITSALIGFVVLALAAVIVTVVGKVVGINLFGLPCIPTLNAPAGSCAPTGG